ncbi:THO complex subunit 2 [Ceratocystis lukuohia]|uniref:THO complex subunit 2 n=1 Tax=Ceratocystis lukuohia TaxID=2019550 RepID=A0ABR4MTI0_9PEZI
MAPQNKRKRDGAQDSNRPSPHKPNDQHNFPRDRDDASNRRNRRRNDHRDPHNAHHPHNIHNRPNPNNISLNSHPHASNTPTSDRDSFHNGPSPVSTAFSPSSRPVSSSSQAANTTSAPPNTTGSPFTFNANPASNTSALSATTSAAKANPDANAPDNAPFVPLDTSIQYDYFRLSSDVLEKWNNGGRDEIIDSAAKLVSGGDYRELTYWTKDLIWSVLSGNLQPVDAGEAMKQILGPPPSNEGAGNHGVGRHDDEDNINSTVDQYGFEPHAHFADTLNVIFEHDITRYRSHLIYFLKATGVKPMMLRELCDTQLLIKLGLIRETFPKLGIRHATNQLYRQTNYNLLREETEGYSKLMTELFTAGNAGPPTGTQARATFERIKALIGTFDLDVGRVLDVTLDVFASMLIKHFQFYVKLLRCSSWWPREEKPADSTYCGGLPDWALPESEEWQTNESEASPLAAKRRERDGKFWERARELHSRAFFELSGRHVVDEQTQSAFFSDVDTAAQVDARRRWIMETKTLPAPGNRTAAQLLGFKLRFYTHDARDSDDVLPANLLYLAALLIKIGFISLTDLVSHLWPDEDGMKLLRDSKMKELEEKERASRPGGAMNALAMAAALPDDTPKLMGLPSAIRDNLKSNDDAKSATHDEKEKPKLPDPSDQKVGLLTSLLTIGAIPEALYLIGRYPWVLETHPEVIDRIHRICHFSIDEVYEMARPSPQGLSPLECPPRDVTCDTQAGAPKGFVKTEKFVPRRALRWPFPDTFDTKDNSQYRFYWAEWADNVPICHSVEDVLTLCDTFLNISNVRIGTDCALVAKLTRIGVWSLRTDPSGTNFSRWESLLRRLLVPALSLTKANPSVANSVWELLQMYPIQTRYKIYSDWYEGPISRLPAIRTAFNRTRLETLSTMKRLSLDNIAQMAKTLAKTSYSSPGIVFKVALDQIESYANLIEVFVECAKYFTELAYDVLVWSLLSSLGAGSRSRHQEDSVLLTSKWLQALSRFSGKVFRRFAIMNPTPVLKYVNRQLSLGNSTDLIILKELVTTMGGIVPSLDFSDDQIMAMCGYETLRRQTLINGLDKRFDSAKSSKRLIQLLVDSKLAGQLLVNIARYRQNAIYTLDDDQLHVKYISSLVDDSHQILIQYLDFLGYNLDTADYVSNTPSIGMLMDKYKLDASLAFMIGRRSLSFNVHKSEPAPETDGDVEMADDAPKTTLPQTNIIYDTLRPLIEDIAKTKSPESWERITPEFFTTFWALQMGDIYVPEGRYEKEYTRAILQSKEVSKERSDMTHVGISKRAEKMKAFADIASQLSVERKQHRATCKKTLELLNERIDNWFQGSVKTPNAVSDAIIEQCLLPRLLLSPAEADFSYRMVRFLHDNNAANFKTMALFDRLFNANRLRSMLFICTVREAENMGRFLKSILTDFSRWHKDKAVYESEALGIAKGSDKRTLHGFATAFDVNDVATTWIEYDQFKDILWGWHKNIFNALKSAMSGSEWLHIRNGITILKCLLDCFPAVDFMARQFTAQLNRIAERESGSKSSPSAEGHRVDLSVAAQTALSELQRRKSKWVMVQSFRTNTMAESNQETTKSTLRPTAPEFRSERLVDRRLISSEAKSTAQSGEAEDGEVRDLPERRASFKQQQQPSLQIPKRPDSGAGLTNFSSRPDNSRSSALPDRVPGLPSRPPAPSAGTPADRFGQTIRSQGRENARDQRSTRDVNRDSREQNIQARDEGREGREGRDRHRDRDSRNNPNLEHGRLERPPLRDLPQAPERRGADNTSNRDKEQSSRRDERQGRSGRDRAISHRGRDEPSSSTQAAPSPAGATQQQQQQQQQQEQQQQQRAATNEPPINPDRAAAIMGTQPSENASVQSQQHQSSRNSGRSQRDESRSDRKAHSPRRDRDRPEADFRTDDRHLRDGGKDHRLGREGRGDSSRPDRRDKDAGERNESSHRESKEASSSDRADRNRSDRTDRDRNDKDSSQASHQRSQDQAPARSSQPIQASENVPSGPRGRVRPGGRGNAPSIGVNATPIINAPSGGSGGNMSRPSTPDGGTPVGLSTSRRRGQGHDSSTGTRQGNTSSSAANTPSGPHDRHRQLPPSSSANNPGMSSHGVHPDRLVNLAPSSSAAPSPAHQRNAGHSQAMTPSDRPNGGPRGGAEYNSGQRNSEAYGSTVVDLTPSALQGRNSARSGGGQRQLAGINSALQQSIGGDRSNRRQNGSGRQSLGPEPPVPTGPSNDRPDDRDRARIQGADEHRGSRSDRDRRDRGRDRDRGNGRRNGRDNSRDHQRERERQPRERDHRERSPDRDREKEPRDYRERDRNNRSDAPPPPPPPPGLPPRDMRDSRRGGGRDRDHRHRGGDNGRQSLGNNQNANNIRILGSSGGSNNNSNSNGGISFHNSGPAGGVNAAPIGGSGDREKPRSRR